MKIEKILISLALITLMGLSSCTFEDIDPRETNDLEISNSMYIEIPIDIKEFILLIYKNEIIKKKRKENRLIMKNHILSKSNFIISYCKKIS